MQEKQITFARHGHLLTNAGVWSPDGRRIVYDTRSNLDGSVFDGTRIETVDVRSGAVEVLYESKESACCGVATYSPIENTVVFILGPERPTPDWRYGFGRRQGVMVSESRPKFPAGVAINLDARDLTPPFTPGALRGGTHLHLFSPDGRLVSFTYHDLLVPGREDRRNIGVSVLGHRVCVPKSHQRNHDGSAFSVLVTRTTSNPEPGSDEIGRACEEAWVGSDGRMIAFQGEVVSAEGERLREVFVVELPSDLTVAGDSPLQGTPDAPPAPPIGTVQRRLTFNENGLSGPRHWLRSCPDGSRIGFLMRDEQDIVQFWTVSPAGGEPRQMTRGPHSVESSFTWSPDGESVAMVIGGSVGVVDVKDGGWREVAPKGSAPIRPEACVFSPDGGQIAYMRVVDGHNQIFTAGI
jgi:dipeptidyl aminopeptidase/acylaminoacyl peptidase